MPSNSDPSSPAYERKARAAQRTQAISTIIAATDLFTVAAVRPYTELQTGDIVSVTGTVTGAAGLVLGTEYYLVKVSTTTFKLSPLTGAPGASFLDVTSDMSAGAPLLTYGNSRVSQVQGNIVSAGSVAGGSYDGPLV
jgi:hypothetical protein